MTVYPMPLFSLLSLCLLTFTTSSSQTRQPAFERRSDVPALITFLAPFLIPKLIQDEYQLKAYICSDEFAKFREQYGDVFAVDAIFNEAMRLSWNNVYEALLISCIATMEHRRFGIKLGLLGPLLWVPLTSEFEDEFRTRVNALPTKLYDDTPAGLAGDRDKLQHFFGSAFLTYTFETRDVAERIGEFIEWGEDAVVVDGALDERDFRANKQGQEFGLRLLEDKSVFPSSYVKLSAAQRDSVPNDNVLNSLEHVMELK